MRRLLLVLVLGLSLQTPEARQVNLTETQTLKGKLNHANRESLPARFQLEQQQLRAKIEAELQQRLKLIQDRYMQESVILDQERQALEAEYRRTLQPDDAFVFDWAKMVFATPPKS